MTEPAAIRLTTPIMTKALVTGALGAYHPCAETATEVQMLAGKVAAALPRRVASALRDVKFVRRHLLAGDSGHAVEVTLWRDANVVRIRFARQRDSLVVRCVPWNGKRVGAIDEIDADPSAAKAMMEALTQAWSESSRKRRRR